MLRTEGTDRSAVRGMGPAAPRRPLEKWARECLRGGGPPANEPPHCAALTADAPERAPRTGFVPAWRLSGGHPDFRPPRAGEERAEQAVGEARGLGGSRLSPECRVPSDPGLGLPAGFAAGCALVVVAVARAYHVVGGLSGRSSRRTIRVQVVAWERQRRLSRAPPAALLRASLAFSGRPTSQPVTPIAVIYSSLHSIIIIIIHHAASAASRGEKFRCLQSFER